MLGDAFKPGRNNQFCKPTSVASLEENGDFFVADGYCNSRIIKYSFNGQKILEVKYYGNLQNKTLKFFFFSGAKIRFKDIILIQNYPIFLLYLMHLHWSLTKILFVLLIVKMDVYNGSDAQKKK